MTTAEFNLLREELTEWIQSVDDSRLLNLLNSIKLSATSANKDWWDELTDSQREEIRLGLQDYEQGNLMSSHSFWKELDTNV